MRNKKQYTTLSVKQLWFSLNLIQLFGLIHIMFDICWLTPTYRHTIHIPSGGKPRQHFERFEKCRFRQSETTDPPHKKCLNFPGQNQVVFTCCPEIYRELCLQKVCDVFFSLSARHALLQRATCLLQKIFFGVQPTQLPDPDASHQLWIQLAVDFGRKTTWHGRFWQPPHCIHPTCVNQSRLNSFLIQKIPLEWLQASCPQPNLALKDAWIARRSIGDQHCFLVGDCFTKFNAWLARIRAADSEAAFHVT